MLLADPKTPERLELGSEKKRRVFLLKVPLPIERAKWRRGVARAGGRQHGQLALLDCLRAGTADLMAESPAELRELVLARIDTHRENLIELHRAAVDADLNDGADREAFEAALATIAKSGAALATIEVAVLDSWAPYANMVADEATFHQIAGIEGARLFLVGWEGIDAPFRRIGNETSEACMALISDADFVEIGTKLQAMTQLTEKRRKNSFSPPSTPSGGETSSIMSQATNGPVPNSASPNSGDTPLN